MKYENTLTLLLKSFHPSSFTLPPSLDWLPALSTGKANLCQGKNGGNDAAIVSRDRSPAEIS